MSGRLDFVYSYSYCQCMQYSCYSPRLDGHINRLFFPIGWQAIIIHERCHCILYMQPAAAHCSDSHWISTSRHAAAKTVTNRLEPSFRGPAAKDVVSTHTNTSDQ